MQTVPIIVEGNGIVVSLVPPLSTAPMGSRSNLRLLHLHELPRACEL
jgi:hypothetical protein